jgi:hypothetical protein
MTTDQNIIQEDQMPDVEVLAAVFPAQPEGPSGDRGWGGEGWGTYRLETELSQTMLLFDTDVYRLSFKDGLVYLAAGTTCQPERRAQAGVPGQVLAQRDDGAQLGGGATNKLFANLRREAGGESDRLVPTRAVGARQGDDVAANTHSGDGRHRQDVRRPRRGSLSRRAASDWLGGDVRATDGQTRAGETYTQRGRTAGVPAAARAAVRAGVHRPADAADAAGTTAAAEPAAAAEPDAALSTPGVVRYRRREAAAGAAAEPARAATLPRRRRRRRPHRPARLHPRGRRSSTTLPRASTRYTSRSCERRSSRKKSTGIQRRSSCINACSSVRRGSRARWRSPTLRSNKGTCPWSKPAGSARRYRRRSVTIRTYRTRGPVIEAPR